MNSQKDTYNTIDKASQEVIFKDGGSKFIGYVFPVISEEEIKKQIDILKKKHYNAHHWCYAWQLSKLYSTYRISDDGEPANSAGAPIYGQIKSFELTNVLVVVVRYFGGTKLGVGRLIQAYKIIAKKALEVSKVIKKTINDIFLVKFYYPEMNKVMRIIKDEKISVKNQKMGIDCVIIISVRKKESARIFNIFENTYKVSINKIQ